MESADRHAQPGPAPAAFGTPGAARATEDSAAAQPSPASDAPGPAWKLAPDGTLVVSRRAMQWLDRRAIDHYRIPEIVLMESAGAGCARIAVELLGGARGRRVHLLCGRGNNGGDGFVIARRIADAGADARTFVSGGAAAVRPGGAAHANLERLRRLGLPVEDSLPGDRAPLGGCDLLVDALFGTGLDRPLEAHDFALVEAANACGVPILAVDIPSGLDADTGLPLGAAVRARRTVALAFPKLGFGMGEGPERTGEVTVVDIGIPRRAVEDLYRMWPPQA